MRTILVAALGLCLTLTTAACSSSGPAGTSPSSVPATPSTSTPASSSSSATSGSSIRLSGAYTGTLTATLCAGDGASIAVALHGDSEIYRGSISAMSFGFVGPDGAEFSLAAGQPKPTVAADGSSFTVNAVTIVDLVSGKRMTATGTVTCP